MGACLPKNTNKKDETLENAVVIQPRHPLIKLKRQLQTKLNLEEDHHFNVFVQYSFWKSYRRERYKFEKRQKAQADSETDQIRAEHRAGLPVPVPVAIAEDHIKQKKADEVPPEDNMLLVTWFEDPVNLQKEHDVIVQI